MRLLGLTQPPLACAAARVGAIGARGSSLLLPRLFPSATFRTLANARQLVRLPNATRRPVSRIYASTAAAAPQGNEKQGVLASLATACSKVYPALVLGVAVWAAVQQPALISGFLQPSFTSPALAVAVLSSAVAVALEATASAMVAAGRSSARFLVQYGVMPLLGYLVSSLAGLPLVYAVWLCLAGGCVGSLLGSAMQPAAAPPAPASAPVLPTAAAAAVAAPEADAEDIVHAAVPANWGPGPASVQAFISRWGTREGIEAAYVPPIGVPDTVQTFISRWGRRDGIEAAYAGQLQVVASKPASQSVLDFINRWGKREGIEAAAQASAAAGSTAAAVAYSGAGGMGVAAWQARDAAPPAAASSNGKVKQAVAALEAALAAPAAAASAQARAVDMNSLHNWGPRRAAPAAVAAGPAAAVASAGSSANGKAAAAGTLVAPVPAKAPVALADPLAVFSAESRLALVENLTAAWAHTDAPAAVAPPAANVVAPAPAADDVPPAPAAVATAVAPAPAKEAVTLYDPLAIFSAESRLAVVQSLTAAWTRTEAPAALDMPAVAPATAQPATAAPAPSQRAAADPLACFDGPARLQMAEHYTALWSEANWTQPAAEEEEEQQPQLAPHTEIDPTDPLAPFAAAPLLDIGQQITKSWTGSSLAQPQPQQQQQQEQAAVERVAALEQLPAVEAAPVAPKAAELEVAAAAAAAAEVPPMDARLAQAPASVQAFIGRWGTREGIEAAAAAGAQAQPKSVVSHALKAFLGGSGRFAGLAPEARALSEGIAKTDAAQLEAQAAAERLAQAPPSAQEFISRWGTREGIEGAARAQAAGEWRDALRAVLTFFARWLGLEGGRAWGGDAAPEAAPSVYEAGPAGSYETPASAQAFIVRWGTRAGIERAAGAAAAAARREQAWVALGQQAAALLAGPQQVAELDAAALQRVRTFLARWLGLEAGIALGGAQPATSARLAQAPPSVQAFISRWGTRDGIERATAAAVGTAVAAAAVAASAAAAQEAQAQQGAQQEAEQLDWPTVGEQAAALWAAREAVERKKEARRQRLAAVLNYLVTGQA